MIRHLGEVRHVKAAVGCSARNRNGAYCEARTNMVCKHCDRGVCGRHETSHYCPTGTVRR